MSFHPMFDPKYYKSRNHRQLPEEYDNIPLTFPKKKFNRPMKLMLAILSLIMLGLLIANGRFYL